MGSPTCVQNLKSGDYFFFLYFSCSLPSFINPKESHLKLFIFLHIPSGQWSSRSLMDIPNFFLFHTVFFFHLKILQMIYFFFIWTSPTYFLLFLYHSDTFFFHSKPYKKPFNIILTLFFFWKNSNMAIVVASVNLEAWKEKNSLNK